MTLLPPKPILLAGLLAAFPGRAELLVHLPFDGSGANLAAPEHPATPNHGAGFDTVNFKLGGAAASFNGSNYFNIPAYFPVIGNSPRSVSFWERSVSVFTNDPNVTFLGWGEAGIAPNVRFDVCLENNDNHRLRCEFNQNPVVSTAKSVNFCDGAWHQVVVTYDSVAIHFYVDGLEFGEAIKPARKLQTGGQLAGMIVGAGMWQANSKTEIRRRFFTGQMDDVGVWNSALTAEDAALINGLGRIGDNDLRWLSAAQQLWARPFDSMASINGHTWMKVSGLTGPRGTWRRVGEPNGRQSFIVVDDAGNGLKIIYPWWDHGWARFLGTTARWVGFFLGLLALGGGLFWLMNVLAQRRYLRRLAVKESQEKERRRIAQDLHDDLGSGLTEIIQLGDMSPLDCRTLEEWQQRVKVIAQKTRDLVTTVDEIVWTVNPRNDAIPNLAGYLSDYAQEFFRVSPIHCRLEIAGELPVVTVSAMVRHHFFLAFKEVLNNVARHSRATEVWVQISCEAGRFTVRVRDNGVGFDPATVRAGNGLANLQSRFEQIGGRVKTESTPGAGTTVEFILPFTETPPR